MLKRRGEKKEESAKEEEKKYGEKEEESTKEIGKERYR